MDSFKTLKDRGFLKQSSNEDRLHKLLSEKPVVFYVGFDPTADSLHIGSLVPIMAIAHLQKEGHVPICLIGGGTALIGDPSGKTEMRKMLSNEVIQFNGERIKNQLSRYISFEDKKGLFLNNFDWLGKLNYIDFLREVGKFFKVNEMIKSESCKIRLERQEGLSFIEFNYQLLQAYDFLVLSDRYNCSLQMGGDDQWGNMVAGTGLVRQMREKEVFVLTFPLLETANGKKMGKTESGAIWLDSERTTPFEFYQYWINTDDRDVIKFLKFFTFLSLDEIKKLEELSGAEIRKAKEVLAFEVTKIAHGIQEATNAMNVSRSLFDSDTKNQEGVPSVVIDASKFVSGIMAVDLFYLSGLASSKTMARKLIEQGGAYLNNDRISSVETLVTNNEVIDGSVLLRQGKKNYRRVLLS